MFNKQEFSNILQKINSTYTTMTEFAQKAAFDRTYISKYINMRLNNPPTPKILEKISNASNDVVTYNELMRICGYISLKELTRTTYPGISTEVWKLLFGNIETFYLTDKESIIWSEMVEKISLSEDNLDEKSKLYSFYYNLDDYINKEQNQYEKDRITRLYLYYGLVLSYFTKNKAQYQKLVANIEQLGPLKSITPPYLTEEDINFIKNIKKLDETNKMIIKNTMEALLDKQEKDEKKED